jgi:transposase-like protein
MEKLFAGDGEVKVGSDVMDLETRLSVIQALIPLGLEAVADVLQQEVEQLAGVRYARKGSEQSHRRWGSQKGSVYLMDQKLPVDVPRVRDVESDTEVSLAAYRGIAMDEKLLLRVLKGISCRNYRACAESVERSESRHPPSRDGSSKPPRRS